MHNYAYFADNHCNLKIDLNHQISWSKVMLFKNTALRGIYMVMGSFENGIDYNNNYTM